MTVKEDRREVLFAGDGDTQFWVSKPDGWPLGNYNVEVLLDGKSVHNARFAVE